MAYGQDVACCSVCHKSHAAFGVRRGWHLSRHACALRKKPDIPARLQNVKNLFDGVDIRRPARNGDGPEAAQYFGEERIFEKLFFRKKEDLTL